MRIDIPYTVNNRVNDLHLSIEHDVFPGNMLHYCFSNQFMVPLVRRNQSGGSGTLSYNYGSGNYDRVIETAKTLLRFQFMFFVPMTALLELFPEVFIRIFSSDPAVIEESSWMVRLYSAGFFMIMRANSPISSPDPEETL